MWVHKNGRFTWEPFIVHDVASTGTSVPSVAEPEPSPSPSPSPVDPVDKLFVNVAGTPAQRSEPAVGVRNDNALVHSGVVHAFVVHEPRAELSGIYQRTINGAPAAPVVIIHRQDNSFIMAQTKSHELDELKARLDGLTTIS